MIGGSPQRSCAHLSCWPLVFCRRSLLFSLEVFQYVQLTFCPLGYVPLGFWCRNIGDICNVSRHHCLNWEIAIFCGVLVLGVFYDVTENQLLNLCKQNEWQRCLWDSRRSREKRVPRLISPVQLAVHCVLRQCLPPREQRHLTVLNTTNLKKCRPKFWHSLCPHNWMIFWNCCILWMTVWGR